MRRPHFYTLAHFYALAVGGIVLLAACKRPGSGANADWPVYGGNKAGNRYSALTQINADNVQRLQVAWMFDASDKTDSASGDPSPRPKQIQCQPIVIRGVLYGTTPSLNLFAVNAATGALLWKFDCSRDKQYFNTNRGVMYWENGSDKRILYTAGSTLYAVNAQTGKAIPGFGNGGRVDLHEGLGNGLNHDVSNLSVTSTSPGVVYKNTLILGSSVTETGDAAPGHIRGFDIVTGKLKWIFHTVPQPGEFGYDTWPKGAYQYMGAANCWGGLTLDEKRGVVYFGTGSPCSDFYGGARAGMNLFANCVMALDAETGKMKWYYQTIHHDLWDRDIPCPPNLATIRHNGRKVDVVVQATKDGLVYVLDRDSGTSIFPVTERPVPTNGLPGEHPWPTQKFPSKPLPLSKQVFTEDDITDLSPAAHDFVKRRFLETTSAAGNNKFIPPSEKGTIALGYSGGAEWGGNAIDTDGIFYQNANDDPWDLQMIDMVTLNKEIASFSEGHRLYVLHCSGCHGMDRSGDGHEFPNLQQIAARRSADQVQSILKTGSGRMPSFAGLPDNDREAIGRFLMNTETRAGRMAASEHGNEARPLLAAGDKKSDFPYIPRYVSRVWKQLTDSDGYPGIKPPWGTLNAINLNTGDYVWTVPYGEYPELTKKGIPITGARSYGGPLVTAGGLIFIAGTSDEKIRAFDKKTGKQVWEYQLPAGGFASPITYEVDGVQYIAIAAAGARGGKAGGNYVAFRLK